MHRQHPSQFAPTEDYWRALMEQGEVARGPSSLVADRFPRMSARAPGCLEDEPGGDREPGDRAPADAEANRRFWSEMRSWLDDGRSFEATCIGCNRGGLLVRILERIAFLPASQMAELPCSMGNESLRADLERHIGRTFVLRLIEVDPERDRIICSERATQWRDNEIEARLDELEGWIGKDIDGTVRSVCDYGAFVDLDHVDGLVHISEMGWQRVDHPSNVIRVGDMVHVRVLAVDRTARRVALSLKQLQPDPWQAVSERYTIGEVIDAVITNVVGFGAFALVGDGVEGLVHISELSDQPFEHPLQVVREGQSVRVRVLSVDASAHRLGLSLRRV